jgi:ABC-type uncharacterized transport system permease subunit
MPVSHLSQNKRGVSSKLGQLTAHGVCLQISHIAFYLWSWRVYHDMHTIGKSCQAPAFKSRFALALCAVMLFTVYQLIDCRYYVFIVYAHIIAPLQACNSKNQALLLFLPFSVLQAVILASTSDRNALS